MMAVKGKRLESTRVLMREIHNHDVNGWEPLPLAARAGDRDMVEALLEADIDAEATGPVKGLSAIEIAMLG
jgi:ankyrin repeat protein